ncbi:MAG: cytochrome-c oxidase, cbb3-type subunit III [Pseudomonadota bacterium]
MAAFWQWFVAGGTIVFVVWCAWIIWWATKQGPQNVADDEVVGHKWDGDLEEWNNPAPKWWLYLYFITLGWAVLYMILYPGVGAFEGTMGWSSAGQYEQEMADARDRYEPIYERYAAMPFEERMSDPDALRLGSSLYASYCTTCHGSDARGATGYPNLTDASWIWGSGEEQIYATLMNGRNAIMPQLGPALGGDAGIDNMTTYVRSLSGAVEADDAAAAMQPMFVALCGACHMPDGSGNPVLGAPNLTDGIWLYGGSEEDVRYTIANGRNGIMPAHGELLGENRARILAAYVRSLSAGSLE